MDTDTPPAWLERAADTTPDAVALVVDGGPVSYADLAAQVRARARSLHGEVSQGDPFPVVAHLDLPTIVEIFAVTAAGGVLVPHDGHVPEIPARPPEGTAVCIATSGSGGRRRLVPLSHGNVAASVRASRTRIGNGPNDRWLATLPLTHVGGLSVLWRTVEAGGTAVVSPFGPHVAGVLSATRPTIASLVPTMVLRLLDAAPDDLAAVGTVLIGGARLEAALRRRAERAGVTVVPTYGMTETASQIATAVPGRAAPDDPAVVGPPIDGFEVTIDGDPDLPAGTRGRIVVDGPAVFAGYLGEPPRSGPFRTSDVGYLTGDGDLAVVGRADDVVVTGGVNVDLVAVRDRVVDLPGVLDAAVVGVPDPEWGTAVCVLVEGPDPVEEPALREMLAGSLPGPERPRRWRFGPIPLLPAGKHDRRAVERIFTRE